MTGITGLSFNPTEGVGVSFGSGGHGLSSLRSHYRKLASWQARQLPSKQVAGFRRAGVHPLWAMGGGSAVSGGAVGSIRGDDKHVSYKPSSPAEDALLNESVAKTKYWNAMSGKVSEEIKDIQASRAARIRQSMNSGQDKIKIGDTVLTHDNKRGSNLDEIGEKYGDEFADIVGVSRATTDWYDQRFKPSVRTAVKEIGNAGKKARKRTRNYIKSKKRSAHKRRIDYIHSRNSRRRDVRRTNPYRGGRGYY